jgi:hypothetical protein
MVILTPAFCVKASSADDLLKSTFVSVLLGRVGPAVSEDTKQWRAVQK